MSSRLLLPELTDGEGAVPVITRIRAALERPVYVHSLPLAVEAINRNRHTTPITAPTSSR